MILLIQVATLVSLILHVFCTQQECHPYYCVSGQAKCDNYGKTCDCIHPPYFWGDGTFACYEKDEIAAQVRGDVVLSTFNGDCVKFKSPVRYLLTSVRLELKKAGHKIGTSTINVHAFNKRINGKIVVDGVEIAVLFEFDKVHNKSLSIITYGQHGHVTLGGTIDDFVNDGHFGKDLIKGPVIYSDHEKNIEVKRYYNEGSRQYVFEIKSVGFRSTFVPYDLEHGFNSVYVPGVAVAINKNYNPHWLDLDQIVAQPPVQDGHSILDFAQRAGVSMKQGMVFRAFTVDVEQNQPGGCKKYSDVAKALHTCDTHELPEALENCIFILESTSFIRCLSPDYPKTTSDEHLSVFETCVKHYCDGFKQCDDLSLTGCHDRQLDDILDTTCKKHYESTEKLY